MVETLGILSAEALMRAGATRSIVIPALQSELGLTDDEAAAAWDAALAKIDAEYPYVTACTDLPTGRPFELA